MDTRLMEASLARKYNYQKLSTDRSIVMRNFYKSNIPQFLSIDGDTIDLFTCKGTLICHGYERIVIGDYGAFIEIDPSKMTRDFVIKSGQEYRLTDPRYNKNVKYLWLTIDDSSDIKIYLQRKSVTYADYKPKYFYVSVHEVGLISTS